MPDLRELEVQAPEVEVCAWCACTGDPDLEYHCACCDEAVCALCVVLVGFPSEPWCATCHAEVC